MSNTIIEIEDGDRGINLTLSVDYSWLPEGAFEIDKVELVRGLVWFGRYALALEPVTDDHSVSKGACKHIAERYEEEIRSAVHDAREAMLVNAHEGE